MNVFVMNQSSASNQQSAEIVVPDCGTFSTPDAPIIRIEKEGGKITLYVYSDSAKADPTHTIDLSGAKNRKMVGAQPEVAGISEGDQAAPSTEKRGIPGRVK